jgi:hypothetical protein
MHPLDNVIWQALTTRQREFAEAFGEARRFQPEVTALTALLEQFERVFLSRRAGSFRRHGALITRRAIRAATGVESRRNVSRIADGLRRRSRDRGHARRLPQYDLRAWSTRFPRNG